MKNNIRANVIVNIIRTLVLTILSFITYPWVCRYLGDTAIGTYSWAVTFVGYFLILAKIGVPNLAIKECVKVRDDKEKLSNKVQLFFIIQAISTIASFGIMCALVFLVPALKDNSSVIFILSLNFLTGAFSFEWVFIALEKQFYMSVRTIVTLALSAILVVSFVSNPGDIYIYSLITVSVTIFSVIANLFYIRKFISFKKTMPFLTQGLFKPLLTLCALTLFISAYNQTDTFILGFIDQSKAAVGSYSVGIKSIDIIIGFITALSTVFIPASVYYWNKEDKTQFLRLTKYSINICLFIIIPAIITMMVLAKPITNLISGSYASKGYNDAKEVLLIIAPMMLTYSLSDIIYNQILLPQNKERIYLYTLMVATLLNIGLSLLFGLVLFKDHPAIGVAVGTMIVDVLIIVFLVTYSFKWLKKALFNFNTLKLFIVGLVILASSIGLKFGFENAFINFDDGTKYILIFLLTILIDAVIYLGLLAILKEDLVYSFIKKKPTLKAKSE